MFSRTPPTSLVSPGLVQEMLGFRCVKRVVVVVRLCLRLVHPAAATEGGGDAVLEGGPFTAGLTDSADLGPVDRQRHRLPDADVVQRAVRQPQVDVEGH